MYGFIDLQIRHTLIKGQTEIKEKSAQQYHKQAEKRTFINEKG